MGLGLKIFSFVILNYNTYDETLDCIKYLKQLENQDMINIIVVDNNSTDRSGIEIEKYYINDNQVTVLFSNANLGFARGNNIGFEHAKYKQNADFIILCNSDTELLNKDFCKIVIDDYDKYGFALLGPKIILPDNSIQGFLVNGIPTKKDVYKILLSVNLNYFKMKYNINFNVRRKRKNDNIEDSLVSNNVVLNKTLSGCFYVFSKKYIELFDGLDNRTFMYGEEVLLSIILHKHDLITIYDPNIVINHLVGASIDSENNNLVKKQKFLVDNVNKSMKVVLKELNSLKNY